jgi:hypothetical protein
MAYDAATGTAVLFDGIDSDFSYLGDTWTWNGTTWTQQASSPYRGYGAGMAYDAATGTVVLFGGESNRSGHYFLPVSTWTWG